jgi:thymidylate kinase
VTLEAQVPAIGPTDHHVSDADWVGPFLTALFAGLDEAGLNWLIPRNHQDLPDRVGHDVDILVDPADANQIDPLLRGVIHGQELILLRDYVGIEHHAFDVAAPNLRGRLVLHVDFQTALQYRGRTFVPTAELLATRRRVGAMWVPSVAMEAYVLMLHAALHKQALKPKYAQRLRVLKEADPDGFARVAAERVGPHLAERLAAVGSEPDLLALSRPLARAIDRRYPSNLLLRPSFVVRSALRQAVLRLRPRGVFVVFLGPDGSGKSSTADLIAGMLGGHDDVLPIHRVYLGSGKPLLPTRRLTRRLRGKTGSRASANPNPLRDVVPRRLRGALHVMADEIARYWIHVRPRLSPHGIVLADRYAYDVLRVNNPTARKSWFRRLVVAIVPAPDVTFFLDGAPDVVAARKQELTVEETIRQQAAYKELESVIPGFTSIDITLRNDAALRGIALMVLGVFAQRNRGFLD